MCGVRFLVRDGWSASQQASGEVSSRCWLRSQQQRFIPFFLYSIGILDVFTNHYLVGERVRLGGFLNLLYALFIRNLFRAIYSTSYI